MPAALGETIAALMPRASRARHRDSPAAATASAPSASASTQQCWKPFGSASRSAASRSKSPPRDAALADLPSVVLPLAVPDLPVILWCRSARLVQMPEFREIARMATKVVLDSAAAAQSRRSHLALGGCRRAAACMLADLAWTRLTRWRETLARVFENRDTLARLSEVEPHPGDASARATRLPPGTWPRGSVNALADAAQVWRQLGLARQDESLRLELSGGGFRVELSREDDRLVTVVNEQSNCTNLPRSPTTC